MCDAKKLLKLLDTGLNVDYPRPPKGFDVGVWGLITFEDAREMACLECEIAEEDNRAPSLVNMLRIAIYEGYTKALWDLRNAITLSDGVNPGRAYVEAVKAGRYPNGEYWRLNALDEALRLKKRANTKQN